MLGLQQVVYVVGVPVTADEAFNRALQQQHHRQSSWGSTASGASATAPAPADDGPLFSEMHKIVAEEEGQAQQGQESGQNQTAAEPSQSTKDWQREQNRGPNILEVRNKRVCAC